MPEEVLLLCCVRVLHNDTLSLAFIVDMSLGLLGFASFYCIGLGPNF